jgi:hypothetical protein
MPVTLDPGDYDLWLDPEVQDPKRLEPLLVQYTGEEMAAWAIRVPGSSALVIAANVSVNSD